MIIDSQPFFRAGVRGVLAQGDSADPIEILECDPGEDGKNAIIQIAASSPDVILLDIGYPFLNGLELCKKIVRTFPQTKVVILSTNPLEDDNELFKAIRTGAAAYLRNKNCTPAELTQAILRAFRGEYPINDSVATNAKVAQRVLKQFQEIATGASIEDDIVTPLTERELQILTLVADGNANKRIARILGVSEQTIKNHVSGILRKLNANDRAHAVMLAVRSGLFPTQLDLIKNRRREVAASQAPTPLTIYSN
jgi:two-component system response regulator DegU